MGIKFVERQPEKAHHVTYWGDVDDVISGKLDSDIWSAEIAGKSFRYGFELGAVRDQRIRGGVRAESCGECICAFGKCYSRSCDKASELYYKTLTGDSLKTTGLAMVGPADATPNFTVIIDGKDGPMTYDSVVEKIFEKAECQAITFGGVVEWSDMNVVAICEPPINNENIFENKAKFYPEEIAGPWDIKGKTTVLHAFCADMEDLKSNIDLYKPIRRVLYEKPDFMKVAGQEPKLTTHTHLVTTDTVCDQYFDENNAGLDSSVLPTKIGAPSEEVHHLNHGHVLRAHLEVYIVKEMVPHTDFMISPKSSASFTEEKSAIDNVNVKSFEGLISPSVLLQSIPSTEKARSTVLKSRKACEKILSGKDSRKIVVIGPCSVHSFDSALEYARKLKVCRDKYEDTLEIIMRVYFEKPRTTVGWKGFINDPDLDGTNNVNKGLLIARSLLTRITDMGLPTACEFLESFTPQYIGDLVSYAAIGARTTPCPLHQKLASGLSMPVGMKNLTDGDITMAVTACGVAYEPNSFLGLTHNGVPAYIQTGGNPFTHIILRGGSDGTNYDADTIQKTGFLMEAANIQPAIIIDSSHANSQKKHKNQLIVLDSVIETLKLPCGDNVKGLMIESHLKEGNQSLDAAMKTSNEKEFQDPTNSLESVDSLQNLTEQNKKILKHLEYGVSITDACLSWEDSSEVLAKLHGSVKERQVWEANDCIRDRVSFGEFYSNF